MFKIIIVERGCFILAVISLKTRVSIFSNDVSEEAQGQSLVVALTPAVR